MPTIGDLVVKLSMESGDVQSQIQRINREVKTLDTAFAATAAQAGGFGSKLDEAKARAQTLAQQLALQTMAVEKTAQALEQARQKQQAAIQSHENYGKKLEEARSKHQALKQQLEETKAAQKAAEPETEGYDELGKSVTDLEEKLKSAGEEVKKLEKQTANADKQIAKAVGSVQAQEQAYNRAVRSQANMNSELEALNRRIGSHTITLEAASESLKEYGAAAEKAGRAQEKLGKDVTTMVTAPIMAAGTAAVTAAVGWESAFAGVRKTVDGTEEDLAGIAKELRNMSKEIPTTANDLAGIAENAGQLGVATSEIVGFTRVVADLAETTNLAVDEASSNFAQFANVTRMEGTAENYSRLGSSVVELGNNLATTEADIVAMSMSLGSAASTAGMTQAEIMGMAAALSSLGLEAGGGGGAMSRTIADIQVAVETGSKDLKEYAKVSGMSAKEFAAAWREDAAGTMATFVAGLGQGTESAIVMLEKMGITNLRERDALLRSSNAAEMFSKAINMSTAAWNQNVAITKEAAMRYDTMESRMAMVANQAKDAAVTFGGDLMPALEGAVDWISTLVDKFSSLDESQRGNILRWAGMAAAVGPAILVLGKANSAIGAVTTALGQAAGVAAAAGGGLNGLLSAAGSLLGPAGVAALAAATVAGASAFVDYASGARAAREALQGLSEAAKSWAESNVLTSYESSEGLKAFGLDPDAFRSGIQDAQSWLETILTIWTDGKAETNAIVRDNAEQFTQGTDRVREGLRGLKAAGGVSGALGDLDADMERLDEIDASVERILKNRQNKEMREKDYEELRELYEERESIRVRYRLVEDSEEGYGAIGIGVESALSRGADSIKVWADAYAAAGSGLGSFTESLNQQYDAQYRVIDAMTDAEAKQQALADLNKWYNEQSLAGSKAYYESLVASAEQTGVFAEGGAYAGTIEELTQVGELMDGVAKGTVSETELANALAGLDEAQVVEVTNAISAMEQAAASAGASLPEDLQQASDVLQGILGAMGTSGVFSSSLVESLKTMFGEQLSAEVYEVNATLGTEGLSAAYDAWAKGEHAPIVGTLDEAGLPKSVEVPCEMPVTLTGVPETITLEATAPVTLTGMPETVTVEAEAPVTITGLPNGPLEIPANAPVTLLDVPETIGVECEASVTLTGVPETIGVECQAPVTLIGVPETLTIPAKIRFEEGQYTTSGRADLEYTAGSQKVEDQPTFISDSAMERIDAYAAALERLSGAQAELDGIEWGDEGWDEANAAVIGAEGALQSASILMMDMIANGENFKAVAQTIANGLQLLADGALSKEDSASLEGLIESIGTILSGDAGLIGSSLAEGLSVGLSGYGWDTTAAEVAGDIETALRTAMSAHSPAGLTIPVGSSLGEGVGAGLAGYSLEKSAMTFAANAGSAIADAMDSAADEGKSDAEKVGKAIDEGIAEGITNSKRLVAMAARKAALEAVDAARSALGIASPSKVGEEIGMYFDKGLAMGIAGSEGMRSVHDAVNRVGNVMAQVSVGAAPAAGQPIDYELLADAVARRPVILRVGARDLAEAMVRENVMVTDSYRARMTRGRGR
jgi:TP901 family phage tail tape measure protein